ncbi:DUF1501 domain-containing protein [Achromobacter piechaudii]|uniref:DUF1501 domain-containing protein n=1 Tax=Achromobacter piechaudii TaxID=72556 RepID=A0ABN7F458_9BURK|nr:DUF1501 domain-containing protein [Achromobacter piechaudii]CAB3723202.1 hypothetical protein LMG1873_04112 [Achromobacter piechaudii]CAB3895156.1 hypothetical protein LMG2828_04196 [Achromobacter piechaudii]CAB3957355.1 hypothetical protein LMG6103_05165 [Achromobacter piechaudii]
MDRRRLLQMMAAAPLVLGGSRLYAAPAASGNRLLIVFMRGAYDAASLLVPTSSDFYYESRPSIAIARPGSGDGAALPLADGWGLHPALADSLLPFYRNKQLAFVPFAGTDDLTRSHFETQNSIELGQGAKKEGNYRSGFLNRLTLALGASAVQPAAFTSEVPQILRGDARVPNVDLGGANRKSRLSDADNRAIAAMYRDTDLHASVDEGQRIMGATKQELDAEMQAANGNAVSTDKLEKEIRRIARFMSDRYNVGFVDVGGWDTHVGQGGATGSLAGRLGQLGRALAAYADAMGPAWNQTTVVVISEFGRTFRENGNKGTDHGHGTVYWVMGGNVRGGHIAGRQVAVRQDTLFQDRDYPVLNEYRGVFAGLFSRLYGLDKARLAKVFPGVAPVDIGLV